MRQSDVLSTTAQSGSPLNYVARRSFMMRIKVRLLALALLACACTLTFAQDDQSSAQPRFAVLPARIIPGAVAPPASSLPTWNGSFTYSGRNYSYNMVGTAPSSNASTTITTYIIPVKIVITA